MISTQLKGLLRLSKARGSDLFVVGGPLRDLLLKRKCSDFDFALCGASELAREFAREIKSPLVPLDATPGRETYRVVLRKQVYFDFSELQGGSIESDLNKRDFTFNAMAVPLSNYIKGTETFIDPHGGKGDIKKRIIRALPGSVFSDDPLRMLRAFRFMSALKFEIEPGTLGRIKKLKSKIGQVAPERIFYELILTLSSNKVAPSIRAMHDSGLLECLFPQLYKKKSASASLRIQEQMERLLSHLEKIGVQPLPEIKKVLSSKRALLSLASLLYPLTSSSFITAKMRTKKTKRASPAGRTLRKLRAANADIDFITAALACGREASATELKFAGKSPSLRQLYRFVDHHKDGLVPGLILNLADRQELPGGRGWKTDPDAVAVRNSFDFYFHIYLPAKKRKPLLNGDDLIKKLKLRPGSSFKPILDHVEEARVLGIIKTRPEAICFAEGIFQGSRGKS
ncbi:hypothetical protein UZ36_01135 [Candidatus Nitromaritima sp. SCGC AAA799-C22]|nr:hypothetical protein UZ36_01135 [Candidatus Nitromaritima sp. SCGC AAA799-C22]